MKLATRHIPVQTPTMVPQSRPADHARSVDVTDPIDLIESQLRPGQVLKLNFKGGESLVLSGKASAQDSPFDNLKKFFGVVGQELKMAADAAPCASLQAGGELLKPMITLGASDPTLAQVNAIYPMALHGVCIALSASHFMESYRKYQASRVDETEFSRFDYMNLTASALHVATSTAGVIGTGLALVNPSLQKWATIGNGLALTGDAINWGINRLHYASQRSQSTEPKFSG